MNDQPVLSNDSTPPPIVGDYTPFANDDPETIDLTIALVSFLVSRLYDQKAKLENQFVAKKPPNVIELEKEIDNLQESLKTKRADLKKAEREWLIDDVKAALLQGSIKTKEQQIAEGQITIGYALSEKRLRGLIQVDEKTNPSNVTIAHIRDKSGKIYRFFFHQIRATDWRCLNLNDAIIFTDWLNQRGTADMFSVEVKVKANTSTERYKRTDINAEINNAVRTENPPVGIEAGPNALVRKSADDLSPIYFETIDAPELIPADKITSIDDLFESESP